MSEARAVVMKGAQMRIRAAGSLSLALFAAACLGGQTTVPGSLTVTCLGSDAGEIAAHVLGSRSYDVSWQHTRDGAVTDVGSTRATLDVEVAADGSLDVVRCHGSVPVTVELSSEDGALVFSGTGLLSQETHPLLVLDVSPQVLSGSIDFADPIEIMLNEHDGPSVLAHGEPAQ